MNRNLIVRCVFGSLLAASAGCTPGGWEVGGPHDGDLSASDEVPVDDTEGAIGEFAPKRPRPTDAGAKDGEVTVGPRPEPIRRDAGVPWPGKDPAYPPPGADPSCEVPSGEPTDAGIGKDPGMPPIKYPPDAGRPVTPSEACFGLSIGSSFACLSYDDAKIRLSDSCASRGYELVELNQKDDGTCMPGTTSHAWGTCCPRTLPSYGLCTIDVLGDGRTCLDPDTIKIRASEACQAIRATLTNLVIDNDVCAGGSALAEYECCEQVGPWGMPYTM